MATDVMAGVEGAVRDAVRQEMSGMFDELRRFVDRRIAELSAEVHATVQLVDFSEANLSGQLSRIHEQIARVVAMPAAATRNSGLELEAVVQATEQAATRILEAAEAIGTWAGEEAPDKAARASIVDKVNAIFEACSFQDLTGQRIRRAIEHLQRVETMLADMVNPADGKPLVKLSVASQDDEMAMEMAMMESAGPASGPDLGQDEIDRLMA
jgi:chemotaxis protein CheZ